MERRTFLQTLAAAGVSGGIAGRAFARRVADKPPKRIPPLKVIQVLDIQPSKNNPSGFALLDGRGQLLSPGAEPYWMTAVIGPPGQNNVLLRNSAGEVFSPGLWVRGR